MNKKYLLYLFKSKKSLCLVTGLLYVAGYVITFASCGTSEAKSIAGFASSCVILGLLSYVLVPLIYSYVNNKKAVDSYFSLPISRKEAIITSQIFIDLVISVPYLALSVITLLIGLNTGVITSFLAYSVFVLVAVIGVITVVMFETAIFLEANSTFDGIVLMAAYVLIPLLAFLAIDTFQNTFVAGFRPLDVENILSYLSLPIALIGTEFMNGEACLVEGTKVVITLSMIICIIWHIVVSVISLKKNYVERKVERAETVSNQFFSYPFVMYFYVFALVFVITLSMYNSFEIEESLILYFIIFVCYMVANFVYRRKIQIKIKDILFFLITVALVFVFSFAANKTKGFGLSYVYNHNPKNIAIDYNDYRFDWQTETASEDEIDEIINKKYNAVLSYNIYVSGCIKEEDMNKASEALKLIEEKRNESIENLYDEKRGVDVINNNLEIVTNFDEKTFNSLYENYTSVKSIKDKTSYRFAPRLTVEELQMLSKFFNVRVEVYTNDGDKYFNNSLEELLKEVK